MIVKKIVLLISFSLSGYSLLAQQNTYTQYLYWIRYQNQLSLSPSLTWTNEIDNRRFFTPSVQNQLIAHSHLHYRKGKWDYAVGLTLSWGYASRPEKAYEIRSEIRPFLEVNYEVPIKKLTLQNRLRLDDRFISDPGESVWKNSENVVRLRYRLQLRIPVKKNEDNVTTISVRIADEIMLNNRFNTFDQNRIYVTGEFLVSKTISLEAGYIYIYQQKLSFEEFYNRNVFRFSVLHRLKTFKSVKEN